MRLGVMALGRGKPFGHGLTWAKKDCACFVLFDVCGGIFDRLAAHNDPNIALLEVCDGGKCK